MSSMIESLARTRHAERYTAAARGAARGAAGREGAGRLHGTRTRTGWLLVGLGLRLALPSRPDAARGTTLLGR